MKKSFLVLFLIFTMCFILTGCDSNKYKKANELFAREEYSEALELYQKLGDYEDSSEKVKVCEKEIGMSVNADYDFLEKLEQSILDRMETTSTENFDRSAVVNTELSYVGSFIDKDFYDKELKEIAEKYIKGLNIQKDSLNKEYEYEYQIEWQRGTVYRFEALKEAYEKYGFLNDNDKFIGTYISRYEETKKLLEAYDAIEKDISEQTKDENFKWYYDDYEFYCTIKNNTEYTFSTVFEVFFYDENKVQFDSSTAYVENIKPNTSYKVSVYFDDPDKLTEFAWYNYYSDVKF